MSTITFLILCAVILAMGGTLAWLITTPVDDVHLELVQASRPMPPPPPAIHHSADDLRNWRQP